MGWVCAAQEKSGVTTTIAADTRGRAGSGGAAIGGARACARCC